MEGRQARGRPLEQRGVGLEQDADLAVLADFPLPGVDRPHGRQDVGASHQSLVEELSRGGLGRFFIGERAPDERAHRRRPSTWAPQAVAATSSAPTNWCMAASSRFTPVSTVAIPRMICVPNAVWMATE